MKSKAIYILSLLLLAVSVSALTLLVQNRRSAQAETINIERRVTLSSGIVGNVDQLRQMETIRSQVNQKRSLSDTQVEALLLIVNGKIDPILQAKTEIVMLAAQETGCFSDSQKRNVAVKNLVALKNPDLATRQFAISLAGKLGEKSSVPALLPLLNAPEPKVRRLTKEALERLQS